ncbi:MAG: protein-disulfide reductase DsbD domain-containing protein [Acidobacteriaceae bacterium]
MRIWLLALLALAVSAAAAQDFPPGGKPQWVELVSSSTPVIQVAATGGAKTTLEFRVKPQMHINSHQPHSGLLIPTELALSAPKGITLQPQYPAGHDINLPFESEKLSVYTGEFSIEVNVQAKGTSPVKVMVPAELKYQACNDNSCFPPKTLKFELEVQVAQ